MMSKNKYTFGEKKQEYSAKQEKIIDVWISPKYLESRKKVIEMLEKFDYLEESDFWILMNETKTGKMGYTGLIISHNGCLKINDNAEEQDKFNPECVREDKDGYNGSLTFTYCNKEQGIYEIGEVSKENCRNNYPYAMAYKRLFDRVVLKISKLAFYGVYSDSEADEFKEKLDDKKTKTETFFTQAEKDGVMIQQGQIQEIEFMIKDGLAKTNDILNNYNVDSLEKLTCKQAFQVLEVLNKRAIKEKKEKEEVF